MCEVCFHLCLWCFPYAFFFPAIPSKYKCCSTCYAFSCCSTGDRSSILSTLSGQTVPAWVMAALCAHLARGWCSFLNQKRLLQKTVVSRSFFLPVDASSKLWRLSALVWCRHDCVKLGIMSCWVRCSYLLSYRSCWDRMRGFRRTTCYNNQPS